jgi:hypothetical protein
MVIYLHDHTFFVERDVRQPFEQFMGYRSKSKVLDHQIHGRLVRETALLLIKSKMRGVKMYYKGRLAASILLEDIFI